jgi:hypothetical protein
MLCDQTSRVEAIILGGQAQFSFFPVMCHLIRKFAMLEETYNAIFLAYFF